ncbi:MAG: glycosyltransferase family 2 protein [Hyphomicrobiales bacterium]
MIELSLVVPVYNEADALALFVQRVGAVLRPLTEISTELVFVNDGSTDNSLDVLLALKAPPFRIKVVDLSRNFGKEAALTAGLQNAGGQVVVPIDADLQDPPELIPAMIAKWREGYEVVLARRVDRAADSWAKRASASAFYRLHNKIASPQIPENVGDFRLMDRRVVEALKSLPESQRFMKGLFAWVGFRTATIDYARPERSAGSTKFNGWRLWNFAIEGVTSFSSYPLRVWTYLGAVVSLFSFLFAIGVVIRVFLFGIDVPGYASLFVAINFLGGVQLIGIGILGEYLGRNYFESKPRPVYLVRHIYDDQAKQ